MQGMHNEFEDLQAAQPHQDPLPAPEAAAEALPDQQSDDAEPSPAPVAPHGSPQLVQCHRKQPTPHLGIRDAPAAQAWISDQSPAKPAGKDRPLTALKRLAARPAVQIRAVASRRPIPVRHKELAGSGGKKSQDKPASKSPPAGLARYVQAARWQAIMHSRSI